MKKHLPVSLLSILMVATIFSGCKKDDPIVQQPEPTYNLVLKYKFDSTQVRLNNIGQPEPMPAGHAGQSPKFNKMSAHYIELARTMWDSLGKGVVLYHAPETTAGGDNAIDFSQSTFAGDGGVFFKVPLKNITAGEYEYLRVSLAYQNYGIKFYVDTTISGFTVQQEFDATVASFIGYNTYITDFKVKDSTLTVNANKKQGFWAFETAINFMGTDYGVVESGQAPEGATTVPNPIFATSPIPQGSCVVTAAFEKNSQPQKLVIPSNPTKDIVVEVSLSVNKSFEWVEVIADGKWEPGKNENVVDMGIRGMVPRWE